MTVSSNYTRGEEVCPRRMNILYLLGQKEVFPLAQPWRPFKEGHLELYLICTKHLSNLDMIHPGMVQALKVVDIYYF
jgi:hypothetical protein